MDWLAQSVDLYCERCDGGFWAEPINALSNVSFIIASLMAYRLTKREQIQGGFIRALIVLAFIVGIGSFLFHTFATRWAQTLDVAPIFAFQMTFLWAYMTKVLHWSGITKLLTTLAFFAANLLCLRWPGVLNGSLMYAPTYGLIGVFTVYHQWARKPAWYWVATVFVSLSLSLTFRTIDQAVCPWLPIGTHFLWHAINGLVLYSSIMVIVRATGHIRPVVPAQNG